MEKGARFTQAAVSRPLAWRVVGVDVPETPKSAQVEAGGVRI